LTVRWRELGATSYLGRVPGDPIIAPSALKHGVGEEDILHAYRNPLRVWDLGGGCPEFRGTSVAVR